MTRFARHENSDSTKSADEAAGVTSAHESNDIARFDGSPPGMDRRFVTALARGLELLRCFNPHDGYLGVTELASRSGIPKSTVFQLISTPCQLGN